MKLIRYKITTKCGFTVFLYCAEEADWTNPRLSPYRFFPDQFLCIERVNDKEV